MHLFNELDDVLLKKSLAHLRMDLLGNTFFLATQAFFHDLLFSITEEGNISRFLRMAVNSSPSISPCGTTILKAPPQPTHICTNQIGRKIKAQE